MKKTTLLLFLLVTVITDLSFAQIAINTDGSTANSKSILDVTSTTKGMLIPRMLTSERTTFGNTLTASENGVYIGTAARGLNINSATTDGIYIDNVGTPSDNTSSSSKNGLEIAGAEGNGGFILVVLMNYGLSGCINTKSSTYLL